MKTEKVVSLIGGLAIWVVSFIYMIYGTTNKICSSVNDTICLPVYVSAFGLFVGAGFLVWAFYNEEEFEE